MCMNPNVYPLSETQKRSPQVTLNHEPNSSFVFTTKKKCHKLGRQDTVQPWTKHVETHVSQKYLCFPVILPKMETVAK